MAPPLAVEAHDGSRRQQECREDTLLTTAERHFEMLSLRLAMSRPVARSGPESRGGVMVVGEVKVG
jgi:hypothetical protein